MGVNSVLGLLVGPESLDEIVQSAELFSREVMACKILEMLNELATGAWGDKCFSIDCLPQDG